METFSMEWTTEWITKKEGTDRSGTEKTNETKGEVRKNE
jgi:hypothetical protein